MCNFKSKKGFTLMETLAVVAIIGVLAFLITVSVIDYLRSTTKLEYDGYAKSIFVAAQNHLTMAEHEGYLGRTHFGTCEDATQKIYRFVVQKGEDTDWLSDPNYDSNGSVLDLMLPFGSVDEVVRQGSYIIRYQQSPAQVLDVFYWDENGRYAYTYDATDYEQSLLPNKEDKDELRNHNGAVIGYYGGADAKEGSGQKLNAPQLELFNAEKLYVLVDNPVDGIDGAKLKLVVKGLSSNSIKEFMLDKDDDNSYWDDDLNKFKVVLDGVTTIVLEDEVTYESQEHFWQICDEFKPGENIKVYAVAYNDAVFTNIAYSSEQMTNSLFSDFQELRPSSSDNEGEDGLPDEVDGDVVDDNSEDNDPFADDEMIATVSISNMRHLENLDANISKFDPSEIFENEYDDISVIQTTDLDWNDFLSAVNPTDPQNVAVVDLTVPGCYEPISPNYLLSYDGQRHEIRGLKIQSSGYAGLFGDPFEGTSISNLKLCDCVVSGGVAGTLVGRLENGAIRNVLVYQSKNADPNVGVSATLGYAGGLVGEFSGNVETNVGTVDSCAAAVYVRCSSTDSSISHGAGGLIGMAENATITSSYSAGITIGGAYDTNEDSFNVSAVDGSVGGLIGDADGSVITYSYSTCSVFGKKAGGFVGTTSGSIQNCYCTGLVASPEPNPEQSIYTRGAFAAELSGPASSYFNNNYFAAITYPTPAVGNSDYPLDGAEGIMAFDRDTVSYHAFVSYGENDGKKRAPASPYDDTLGAYYQGMYNLKTVRQLAASTDEDTDSDSTLFVDTHYGDWPAPEIMIINTQ